MRGDLVHILCSAGPYTNNVGSSCTHAGAAVTQPLRICYDLFLHAVAWSQKMPPAIPEWPLNKFTGLYMALHKESTSTKLTAADTKAIEFNLPIYIESYFPDTYGDTGTLQGMTDLELRPLADFADIKHKGTNLPLTWTAEDTAAARESAKTLTQRLRDLAESSVRDLAESSEEVKKMDKTEYLEWIAFETRYRLCLDQRPPTAASRRGTNTNNILIDLLKLR
jgi:hypothetical protein